MESSVKTIYHNGVKIYHSDYRDTPEDQFVSQIQANMDYFDQLARDGENEMLSLVDVRGAYLVPSVAKAFEEAGKTRRDQLKATAVVGLRGVLKTALRAINMMAKTSAKPFDDFDEALDWLSKQK
jgi:6,7-dimethyl-8-ribityllumazine synthase